MSAEPLITDIIEMRNLTTALITSRRETSTSTMPNNVSTIILLGRIKTRRPARLPSK